MTGYRSKEEPLDSRQRCPLELDLILPIIDVEMRSLGRVRVKQHSLHGVLGVECDPAKAISAGKRFSIFTRNLVHIHFHYDLLALSGLDQKAPLGNQSGLHPISNRKLYCIYLQV